MAKTCVKKGTEIDTPDGVLVVEEVGDCHGNSLPVRFRDGTYDIVLDWCCLTERETHPPGIPLVLNGWSDPEIKSAVRSSTKMPVLTHGIGSDVIYVGILEPGQTKRSLVKVGCNDRAGRDDRYYPPDHRCSQDFREIAALPFG